MSKIQTGINKARTLIQQNNDLIDYNNSLVSLVAKSMESEVAIGKQEIVDALLMLGVECSMSDSLATLASKVESLEQAVGNVTFTDDMPRPLDMSYFAAMGGRDVITIKDEQETKIRNYAFYDNLSLYNVYLPNVKEIGSYAFNKCINLEECNLEKIETIGSYAFAECKKLKKINVSSVHSLSDYAFQYCESLEELQLPLINSAGQQTFGYCTNLRTLNVENLKLGGNIQLFSNTPSLIDLIFGKSLISNVPMSINQYNPKNAMLKNATTLVDEGEPFTSNNEKWNHNIREYFAANLPDRTGMDALTITFDATVLTNMTDETKLAFTNKNWNLA